MSDYLLALKNDLVRISQRAYNRGLVSGTGGNISVRIPDTELILITASGVSLGDTSLENLVMVNFETNQPVHAPDDKYRPSKETAFHTIVYRNRPEIRAVIHLHPTYATAFSISGSDLPLTTISAELNLKQVPCIPFAPPGSTELSNQVATALMKFPHSMAFMMERHGTITMAPDLTGAYNLSDLIEQTANEAFVSTFLYPQRQAVTESGASAG
jgi:ribulose-5-phosphate 4-epimerase/fuculose-1-phosphate aldolase